MKSDDDVLTFSTGKQMPANRGIVGLCISDGSDDRLRVYEGYDGTLRMPEDDRSTPERRLTPAECVELADKMLEQWAEFRAKYARA